MKKLLSVILSVVMIVSMVACLSFATNAEAAEELKVSVVEDDGNKFIEVSYTDDDPFMVTYIEFAVTGVTIEDNLEIGIPGEYVVYEGEVTDKNKPAIDARLVAGGDDEPDTLKVLVSPAGDLVQYTKVVFDIPATIAEKHSIIPTLMQAAADGNDIETAEHFVELPFTGDGDVIVADSPAVVVEESANPSEGPAVDNSFDTAFSSIVNIKEKVGANIVFTLPADYDDTFTIHVNRKTFNKQYAAIDAPEILWTKDKAYLVSGRKYGFAFNELAMAEISTDVTFTVEATKNGKTYVSNPVKFNLADRIASAMLEKDAQGKQKLAKNVFDLYAECLFLGDAAVNYFKGLAPTSDISKVASPSAAIEEIATRASNYAAVIEQIKETSNGCSFTKYALDVGASPALQFQFDGMTDAIRNTGKIVLSYTSGITGVGEIVVEKALNDTEDGSMKIAGTKNAYTFSDIVLTDTDKTITAKIVSGEGTVLAQTQLSMAARLSDSIENNPSAKYVELYKRVLELGIAARAYFK